MRRRLSIWAVATLLGGTAIVAAPSGTAAAVNASSGLTLAPAIQIAKLGATSVSFLLIDNGSQPVHIVVSSSDAWLTPAESSFDLQGGARHTLSAAIQIPSNHDAGDHETRVVFMVPPTQHGLIEVVQGLAARVIVATGLEVIHDLQVFGLHAPQFADSWDNPDLELTIRNDGNVYALVELVPFGQVLVTRGLTKVVRLEWSHHRFLGSDRIAVNGQSVSTFFFPLRLSGILLALLSGFMLWRQLRRPSG